MGKMPFLNIDQWEMHIADPVDGEPISGRGGVMFMYHAPLRSARQSWPEPTLGAKVRRRLRITLKAIRGEFDEDWDA